MVSGAFQKANATSFVIGEGVAFLVRIATVLALLHREQGYSEVVVSGRIRSGNDDEINSCVALRRGDEPRWGEFYSRDGKGIER